MRLVPKSSIPDVAVLVLPGTDPASFSGPASVFSASHAMRVFTVADTTDPVRCQGYLDVVPTHGVVDLADVRAVDVLEGAFGLSVRPRGDPDVRSHDPLGTEALAQRRHQLGADLAEGAGHQDPAHQEPSLTGTRGTRAAMDVTTS